MAVIENVTLYDRMVSTLRSRYSMLTSKETIALFEQYVIGNYTRYPVSLVRGVNSEVWDAEGKQICR